MIAAKACRHWNSLILPTLERYLHGDAGREDEFSVCHVLRRIKSWYIPGRILLDQNVGAGETENRLTKRALIVRLNQFEEKGLHINEHHPGTRRDRPGRGNHFNQVFSFNKI